MSEEKVIDKCNSKENVNSSQNLAESSKQTLLERGSASGTLETNTEDINSKRDSNISLKSFKISDQNDVTTDDEESKTYNNKNSADNIIQEEENAAKCCNCLSEVSEFVPWFCINIGKWISNSFKNCFCCNKKIDKRKLDIDIDDDDWDPNAANNDEELYRYSLPVCKAVSYKDDGVKVTFHQNKGFDVNDEVKDDKKANKANDDENKEPVKKGNHHHEYETVKSHDIHRSEGGDHSTGHTSGHSTGHTTGHLNGGDIVSDSGHNHANNHSDFAASHGDSGFGGHSGGCDFSSDW